MPVYELQDTQGRSLSVEGDAPPDERTLDLMFAKAYPEPEPSIAKETLKALPGTVAETVKQAAAAQPVNVRPDYVLQAATRPSRVEPGSFAEAFKPFSGVETALRTGAELSPSIQALRGTRFEPAVRAMNEKLIGAGASLASPGGLVMGAAAPFMGPALGGIVAATAAPGAWEAAKQTGAGILERDLAKFAGGATELALTGGMLAGGLLPLTAEAVAAGRVKPPRLPVKQRAPKLLTEADVEELFLKPATETSERELVAAERPPEPAAPATEPAVAPAPTTKGEPNAIQVGETTPLPVEVPPRDRPAVGAQVRVEAPAVEVGGNAPTAQAAQAELRDVAAPAAEAPKPLAEPPPTPPDPAAGPTGPGIVGMGGATPSEFHPSGQTATAIKNAAIEADRLRMGLPKFAPVARQKYGEAWDRAMAEIDRDPAIQDKLIAELKAKPRALANNVESALLEHRMVDLKNEFAKATRDLAQAVDDNRPDAIADAQRRIGFFGDKAYELTEITKAVGVEWGRTGVGRKQWVDDEFNLLQMVADKRANRGGQPLTATEFADAKAKADAFAKIQDRLGKRITELRDKIARGDYGERAKKEPLRDPEIDRLRYQLERIKREWREGLLNERLRNRPLFRRIVSAGVEIPNAIRAIMTSMDLSAVLRQGKFMVLAHPVRTLRSVKPMLEAFASPARALAIETEIAERPNYPLYRQSKLYLSEHGASLSQMEEQWMSRWVEKVPLVRGSQRAYTTFLNKVRADSFDAMARTLSSGDRPLTADEAKVISNYINASTGRGTIGMRENAAVGLNTLFFAPRYVASRFQMLLGQPMWYGALSGKVPFRGTAKARALVASEYARIMAGLGLIYTLGYMAGDPIETDPRSTDFGKIRIGNTRIDPMAGVQQATVLLAREASGKTKTARGRVVPIRGRVPYGGSTAFDVLTRFGRTKLAPVPGTAVDLLQGKNFAGEPTTLGSEALDLVTPMSIADIYKSMVEQGVPKGTALGILSIFGENIQTYDALHPKRTNP